jgi:hypothetical protein
MASQSGCNGWRTVGSSSRATKAPSATSGIRCRHHRVTNAEASAASGKLTTAKSLTTPRSPAGVIIQLSAPKFCRAVGPGVHAAEALVRAAVRDHDLHTNREAPVGFGDDLAATGWRCGDDRVRRWWRSTARRHRNGLRPHSASTILAKERPCTQSFTRVCATLAMLRIIDYQGTPLLGLFGKDARRAHNAPHGPPQSRRLREDIDDTGHVEYMSAEA